ncbi:PAS domain-containing sensor histidine kinase [Mongoliitalea lutea]|uniref:histidine kinase n=1 Tax=Mongoliitalea lutea TaxID=849756 RepID=A0A8J3CYP0_9BACT|nr:ATP-binding protein [Mongoliitalea lutea]GHB35382.1 hypothetical protein GCM10008106_16030 [Mongoliitalea lutea]
MRQGFFIDLNDTYAQIYGFTKKELIGQPFSILVPENQLPLIQELNARIMNGEYVPETLYSSKRKDGTYILIAAKFKILHLSDKEKVLVTSIRDVTEEERTKQLLDDIQKMAVLGGWELNLVTQEVLQTKIAKEIHEFLDHEVMLYEEALTFYPEGEAREHVKKVIEIASTSGSSFDFESPFLTHRKKEKFVRVQGKVDLIDGKPYRIFGFIQDITEKRLQKQALEQLNQQLLEQTKILQLSNEELEKFAYVASHDLQEPLRMVSSFLTQLERKYKDQLDDKAREYIHYAVDGSKRMKKIIMDLLGFSRVGKNFEEPELVDLQEVIEEVLLLQKKLIEETEAKITFDKLPVIKTIKIPVFQIFTNLINNAMKYRKPGEVPILHIGYQEKAKEHEFSVQDNGIGIDSVYFEKIFSLFQRLHKKDEFEGQGIGLAIVKKLIELMGGTIWVESTKGEGSTFYFSLPK